MFNVFLKLTIKTPIYSLSNDTLNGNMPYFCVSIYLHTKRLAYKNAAGTINLSSNVPNFTPVCKHICKENRSSRH